MECLWGVLACAQSAAEAARSAAAFAMDALHRQRAGADASVSGAGSASDSTSASAMPAILLDSAQKGAKVDVSRYCASGSGTALGNVDVEQETAYWEVEVVTPGQFSVGCAVRARSEAERSRLDGAIGEGVPAWSWGVASSRLGELASRDTVGVYLDQRDVPVLRFSVNGEMAADELAVWGVKNDCRPAVSVQRGCILRLKFDEKSWRHPPKDKLKRFGAVLRARQIL